LRFGELRHAEWAEIDFDKPEWRIPGQKMKMKEPHIIKLSVHPLTGDGQYIFPAYALRARPV